MTPDIGNALFTMIQVLDELDIRYALVGGLAIGAWGVNRSTRDVDLYADLASENARQRRKSLETKMNQRGFDIPAMEAELEEFGVFRARSAEGVFVDIFNAVGPLGEAILNRFEIHSRLGSPTRRKHWWTRCNRTDLIGIH